MRKIIILALMAIMMLQMPVFALKDKAENDTEHAKKTVKYLNLEWWANYKDDILTEHLRKLYENNYDLKNAELKIKQSEKAVKMQMAAELPQIGFDAYAGRDFRSSEQRFGEMSIPSFSQNNFQLPITAAYEIDIWGKNRLRTKSVQQELEIVKQAERAVYISLTSDFVSHYYNLIKVDGLSEIQHELIKTQEEILSKTEIKNKAGLCSLNEVLQEKKMLSSFKEEKNNLEDMKEVSENILRSYLSIGDGEILRSHYSDIIVPDDIPEQYNTEVISSRPDFLQREANVKRAGYDVRVARKELLPSFVITGQIGLNAYKFADLFKTSTQLANAGILPTFDIFSGGRKLAFLKLKKYQYDEALNNYQKTMIEDINEVNTALSLYKTSKKNYNEVEERFDVQNKLFNLTYDKKNIGSASELDVLYAKRTDLITKKEVVADKINYIIATVSLYKSVGGKNLYDLKEDL